jgi:hypothetical protein
MASSNGLVLVDLDGTLCRYSADAFTGRADLELLPGTLEKLAEWRAKGYMIVITTGRQLSRLETERQLKIAGIQYDHLVMGMGGGPRHLINDIKPEGTLTAFAHNLPRNAGISSVTI